LRLDSCLHNTLRLMGAPERLAQDVKSIPVVDMRHSSGRHVDAVRSLDIALRTTSS
jgi:hypothetical protein